MAPDTLSLAGKVAIVTGSGRENGIGAAIARSLAKNGASVALHYVSDNVKDRAEKVQNELKELGAQTALIQANIIDPESAKKIVDETLKAFGTGHVDILVNNAGYGKFQPSLEHSPEDAKYQFDVNVLGPLYLTQKVSEYMPKGGRIINISSVASKLGPVQLGVYGATKAALDSFTYSWASELGRSKGITVNSVAPGPVVTDLSSSGGEEMSGGIVSPLIQATRAADRAGTAEEIADIVLLTVSEKASWITGQFISASGGITGP